MAILSRYIFRELSKVIGLSLGAFIAIYLVVDVFQGIKMIMEYAPPPSLVAQLYILKIPNIIAQVLPVVMLMSTLLALGLLSRNGEITAMKSSGISVYKIASPILAVAFLISIASLLSNEYLVPYTNGKVREIEKRRIKKEKQKSFFKQNKIWYRSDNAVYNIEFFNAEKDTMNGVTIYYLGDDFGLRKRLDAKEIVWDAGAWRARDAVITEFENGRINSKKHEELELKLPETIQEFKAEEKTAAEMGFSELRVYIKRLKSDGYDPAGLTVDLQAKLAQPFAAFIMACLGIPFAMRGGRSGGMAVGIGISVLIGFGYWLGMSFFLSFGRVGVLPPAIAAWGANLIFAMAAALMMMQMEGD